MCGATAWVRLRRCNAAGTGTAFNGPVLGVDDPALDSGAADADPDGERLDSRPDWEFASDHYFWPVSDPLRQRQDLGGAPFHAVPEYGVDLLDKGRVESLAGRLEAVPELFGLGRPNDGGRDALSP